MAEILRISESLTKTLGTFDLDTSRAEKEKWLEENKSRIMAEYDVTENFSERELLKIREYEEEKAMCESCMGLPCREHKNQGSKIQIKIVDNSVYEIVVTCKYEKVRRKFESIKKNFKSAKISADYLEKEFTDYEVDSNNREAVQIAKKILKGEENSAYFYGAFGTGKTFLAALTAKEFVKKGVGVLFYKVPFLIKDLQDAMFDKSDPFRESTLLKQICEVPVLILDDFGMSGKISTYAAGRLSMIIDARKENSDLATIITSNLSLKALQIKLDNPSDATDQFTLDGSRIADRLKEMCAVVKFGGDSRRKRKGI